MRREDALRRELVEIIGLMRSESRGVVDLKSCTPHCAKNQVSIPRKPIGNQQETPGLHAVSP